MQRSLQAQTRPSVSQRSVPLTSRRTVVVRAAAEPEDSSRSLSFAPSRAAVSESFVVLWLVAFWWLDAPSHSTNSM